MRRFNSRLERLERELCSIPEAERLERERDLEFGEAIRWLYANNCVWASEAMAQGLTLPKRARTTMPRKVRKRQPRGLATSRVW